MKPSSRTPEGSPGRCTVCGKPLTIEPSLETGDAACPHCGSLVWIGPQGERHGDGWRRSIRGLVGEIAELAKSNVNLECFCEAFTERVVTALAANGGAVWLLGSTQKLQLKFQLNFDAALWRHSDEGHRSLLREIAAGREGRLVQPRAATSRVASDNPSPHLLVLAPVAVGDRRRGIVEILQRPNTKPATQRGYLRFVMNMCELFSEWLGRHDASR